MKSKTTRLLHVFSAPQSAYYFLEGQLQFMARQGFEVHVVIPKDEFFYKKLKEREANVFFHQISLKRNIAPLHDINSLLKLIYLLFKLQPDILHLHTPKASFLGAIAGKLTFQKNIIYQMHGLVSTYGNKVTKSMVYYIEKYTCYLADRIYAVSPSLMKFAIEENYCKSTKISVIGNGTINGIDYRSKFNIENLSSKDKYINSSVIAGRFVIGFVGRISEDKGVNDFLSVVSKINESNALFSVIVGPNEMGNSFSKLLDNYSNLNSSNLLIIDEISDPENIMHHFDILLFPTKREGFGLVAAEANALEVPVVAYDIPGVRDALENNVTGKLVEFNNLEKLKQAVLFYYNNEPIKIEHGNNGRMRVKTLFDREVLWTRIFETYNKIH